MRPYPHSPTAQYLRDAIETCDKTQREIARDAGFAHPNMLSMIKTGESKVPISRIPALAAALGTDVRAFIEIAMHEYHPEIWHTLREHYAPLLSEPEEKLVELYQLAALGVDISWSGELEDTLHGVFSLAAQNPEP
jgi:transcriptional regulator with XRE-family HTH domain